MQKENRNKLIFRVEDDFIPKSVLSQKNNIRSWLYGYNEQYDIVVISKTGQIGQIYNIQGLKIALPLTPDKCYQRHPAKSEQYWERTEMPRELQKIQSIFQWNSTPATFKNRWVDYIERQFDLREEGYWYMNNGVKTYITGSHWMYLQWSSIDVGYPDFREANRILYIFWEACKADKRSYGMIYLKIRRSGFSFMASSETENIGTLVKNGRVGILSKTGPDAKKMFTDKVVPINTKYPFFFRPSMDGMDKPKTELSFRIPASKITKKNMYEEVDNEISGLDTSIDWKNTEDNSYDGEKLVLLIHDEAAKWLKPADILNNWRVTKTCLRLGSKIVGKCMMGSTSNALNKGGGNYKKLYEDSNVLKRNRNGQTKSGLYALFIPMEWNMEGFIDIYGMPIFRTPTPPARGIDGETINVGAIDYWEAEIESLKADSDALNEHYRQFPRTEAHAFRDESKQSLFNLTKIYQQIDYNDSMINEHYLTRGSFHWKGGVVDSEVVWSPDMNGRFLISWIPAAHLRNKQFIDNHGNRNPGNTHLGSFGCDPYDISGTVGGGGSKGACHGMTKFNVDEAPSMEFFLEYIARPQTAEIFFEEILMACVFYGMPILIENNKPRLLYHFKNRGYRKYSLNRPDKTFNNLSKTERELGGIPNSSDDIKQAHASAIETYIEEYVGLDSVGTYREPDVIGSMPFSRTLEDWAKFDINNRTMFDASISSGLAIMANKKHSYTPDKNKPKISINFARYSNVGTLSEIIK